MRSKILKILKILTFAIIGLTLVTLLFGISHFAMAGHYGPKPINCPFMPGHSSICKMSPMEHIQAWQNMFTVLPAKEALSLVFSLLALLALLGVREIFYTSNPPLSNLYRNFFLKNRISIPNPLKEAFSSGILNPKLF